MGLDVDANIAIGAIISIYDNIDIPGILEEDKEEYGEEIALQEYLYNKLETKGLNVYRSNEYSEVLVIIKENTYNSTSWDPATIDIAKTFTNIEEDVAEVLNVLQDLEVKVDEYGVILFPYYSH